MKTLHNSFRLLLLIIPVLVTLIILTGCWGYVNKQAAQSFQERKQQFSVIVYPANVIIGDRTFNDSSLSSQVVFFLAEENLAIPVQGDNKFSYPFQWGMNQAKMNERSARAFAEQVKKDNIQTDYALLPEILCNGNETAVMGASYYLVDKQGQIVNSCLSNSDWENFRKINPKDSKGGIELIIELLREQWKK
jgi:hypothetical protein